MSTIALTWIRDLWHSLMSRSYTLSAHDSTSATATARTGGESNTEWEVVYVAENRLEGEIVRGRLESEDIPAVIRGEALGVVYGLTTGPLAQVLILVPAPLAERARAILAQDEEEGTEEMSAQ